MSGKLRTRNKIMEVSLRLFSEQGYYATTTKQIAQEAGFNELTLFRHFGTKEKLFQETTENYVKDINLNYELNEIITDDFDKSILAIADYYLNFCFENEPIYKIQLRLKDDEKEFIRLKLSRELNIVLSDYFTRLLKEKVIEGDPQKMAVTFINSILGAYTIYLMTNDTFTEIDIHELVHEHARQFSHYYKV